MKISRRGAAADHGESSITLKNPNFSWNTAQKTIEIDKGNIRDFNTDAHHNYTISLSPEEAQKIIQALFSAINENHNHQKT
jgi:hypothetical protein